MLRQVRGLRRDQDGAQEYSGTSRELEVGMRIETFLECRRAVILATIPMNPNYIPKSIETIRGVL